MYFWHPVLSAQTQSALPRWCWLLDPAFQFTQRHLPDHQHAGRAVVEAGNRHEILAAVLAEDMRVLDRDLLERLEAIGGEARRDHRDALDAALGEIFHRPIG